MKSAIIHDGDHVRMTLASCSYFLSLRVANDTGSSPRACAAISVAVHDGTETASLRSQ